MAGIKGMGKGNKNASLAPGQRGRVRLDLSLSDKRLAFFEEQAAQEIYSKAEEWRIPTDEEIVKVAREMFYEWVDSLL